MPVTFAAAPFLALAPDPDPRTHRRRGEEDNPGERPGRRERETGEGRGKGGSQIRPLCQGTQLGMKGEILIGGWRGWAVSREGFIGGI